ncbi:RNA-directed DNA polymerase (Reverse transcriptase), partial [Trifolium medium]|nr:RNA-directed DNA polymerase (Reverse transcriptase) [Trifolium medium]
MPSPNFEFPVFEADEEDNEEIPNEISRLLEHEGRAIQPHEELLEIINLGSEKDKKE